MLNSFEFFLVGMIIVCLSPQEMTRSPPQKSKNIEGSTYANMFGQRASTSIFLPDPFLVPMTLSTCI